MRDAKRRRQARRVVKKAAEMVETPFVKTWLLNDEFGNWEKTASKFLQTAREIPLSKGMTDEEIEDEVVVLVAWLAVQALANAIAKDSHHDPRDKQEEVRGGGKETPRRREGADEEIPTRQSGPADE